MGVTPTYGWEWPDLVDAANAPGAFQTALEDIEATVSDTAVQSYIPGWLSNGSVQPGAPAYRAGLYRVDNGVCHVAIYLSFGPSSSGGSGDLSMTLPLPGRPGSVPAAMPEQVLQAKLWAAAAGLYRGHAEVGPGSTVMSIYFPRTSGESIMARWRNTDATLAAGTGIPLVPGTHPMVNGSNIVISGAYLV